LGKSKDGRQFLSVPDKKFNAILGMAGTEVVQSQIRQIARLGRAQVKRRMNELRAKEVVNGGDRR
jgi:hypothetical protein